METTGARSAPGPGTEHRHPGQGQQAPHQVVGQGRLPAGAPAPGPAASSQLERRQQPGQARQVGGAGLVPVRQEVRLLLAVRGAAGAAPDQGFGLAARRA